MEMECKIALTFVFIFTEDTEVLFLQNWLYD